MITQAGGLALGGGTDIRMDLAMGVGLGMGMVGIRG